MMRTEIKDKAFETVKFFREEKERIANETQKMNFDEFKAYLARTGEWAKKK